MTKIIFFLLVSISAYSQNVIDLGTATWPKGLQYNTDTAYFYQDTSKVLMLLCDTSEHEKQIPQYFGGGRFGLVNKSTVSHDVFFDWGYMVINGFTITYLDKHKKPLNKNFVIWMIKSF